MDKMTFDSEKADKVIMPRLPAHQKSDDSKLGLMRQEGRSKETVLLTVPVNAVSGFAWVSIAGAFLYCVVSAHMVDGYWYLLERAPNATGISQNCPGRVSLKVLSITQTVTSLVPAKWFWRLALCLNFFYTIVMLPQIFIQVLLRDDLIDASKLPSRWYRILVNMSARAMQVAGFFIVPTSFCYDIQVPTAHSPPRVLHRQPDWIDQLHFASFFSMACFTLIWSLSFFVLLVSLPLSRWRDFDIGLHRKAFLLVIMKISTVLAIVLLYMVIATCADYVDGLFACVEFVFFGSALALILDFASCYQGHSFNVAVTE